MKRSNLPVCALAAGIAGLLLVAAVGDAQEREAQEAQAKARLEAGERIRLPAEESMVELWAEYPENVRLGESFQYRIHVRNITDNILLDRVIVRQEVPEGLEIEQSNPPLARAEARQEAQRRYEVRRPAEAQRPQEEPRQQQRPEEAQRQQEGQPEARGEREARRRPLQELEALGQRLEQRLERRRAEPRAEPRAERRREARGEMARWLIRNLKPGETRTIEIQATADEVGRLQSCLAVSYTPALCLATEVVQPEVALVKAVPEAAGICELLIFRYRVENTGTGATEPLVLIDDLPEGLQTRDGENTIRIPLDPIQPGESREFDAEVVATRTGTFGSRAVVRDREEEEVLARSRRATARIVEADLRLDIQGPQVQYVGDPATYTVVVTNTGQTLARDGQLFFQFDPQVARLARAGEPEIVAEGRPQEAERGQEAAGQQPRLAPEAQEAPPKEEERMQTVSWDLGDLEPGETARVQVTLVGTERGDLRAQAIANYDCAVAEEFVETRTVSTLAAEVIALPALLIGVIDQTDPVEVGEEYVYEVVIGNEGAAADENIRLEIQMPEELEFVEGSGTTEVRAEDGEVSIAPVDRLEPGEEVRWQLRVRPTSAADVRFRILVRSDYLTRPATAEEPTRIFSPEEGKAVPQPAGEAAEQPVARPEAQPKAGAEQEQR